MANYHNDIIELPKSPSVRIVLDASGDAYTCWGEVDSSRDLGSQGCAPTEELTYDRGFGG